MEELETGPTGANDPSEFTGLGGAPLSELRALRAPDESLPRHRLVEGIATGGVLSTDSGACLMLETAFLEGVITTAPTSDYTEAALTIKAEAWLNSLSPDELAVVMRSKGSRKAERDHVVRVLLAVHGVKFPE